MGSVLATALVRAGHRVTVWNRTPERAASFAGVGAGVASSARDAVEASDVVVVCVTPASVNAVLELAAEAMEGKVLLNVSTRTPQHAASTARWAAKRGIAYLDGGILAVPSMIATAASTILVSGSRDVFDRAEPVVAAWGQANYVGAGPGDAAARDIALLSAMYCMFGGIWWAQAFGRAHDISDDEILGMVVPWLEAMLADLPNDSHDEVGSSVEMQADGFHLFLEASVDANVDPAVLAPIGDLLRRAVAAGHGKRGLDVMADLLRGDSDGDR
jgi:3-hydroxyisobutyrate dehydrogenase-like beta-hydroxyacid dehydrogenase